jgi:enoyl-CoA hydratase
MTEVEWKGFDKTAVIWVNRPKVRNALNSQLLKELARLLREIAQHSTYRALILTGAGDKAFIAGADIEEMERMTSVEMQAFLQLGSEVATLLETLPLVTLAAVNGYALGGGLEMALACDFIYASPQAILGLPEVKLGLIPGFGGTQRLMRAVGVARAKELIMSGRMISAEAAHAIGLVNKVCEGNTLLEECLKVAAEIADHGTTAVNSAKRAICEGSDLPLQQGLALEQACFLTCFATEERKRAMKAFLAHH